MEMYTLLEGVHEYRNPYLHVVVDNGAQLMYSEWTRQPASEEYRQAALIFADFLKDAQILYWIQDTTVLETIPESDLRYAMEVLVPVAARSALKKLARVTTNVPNIKLFKEMANQMQAAFGTDVEVRQFKSYREAAEWIEGISVEDQEGRP